MSEEYSKDRLTRERDQWRDSADRALDRVHDLERVIADIRVCVEHYGDGDSDCLNIVLDRLNGGD